MHFGVHRHHTDWITTVKVETVESLKTYTCLHSNTEKSLNNLRIQCPDYTKRNTETNTMAARGRETYTCATQNWAYSGLENKRTTKHV